MTATRFRLMHLLFTASVALVAPPTAVADESASSVDANHAANHTGMKARLAAVMAGRPDDAELGLREEMALLGVVADAGIAASGTEDVSAAVDAWEVQLQALYTLAIDAIDFGGPLESGMRISQLKAAAMQPPVQDQASSRVATLRSFWLSVLDLASRERLRRLSGAERVDAQGIVDHLQLVEPPTNAARTARDRLLAMLGADILASDDATVLPEPVRAAVDARFAERGDDVVLVSVIDASHREVVPGSLVIRLVMQANLKPLKEEALNEMLAAEDAVVLDTPLDRASLIRALRATALPWYFARDRDGVVLASSASPLALRHWAVPADGAVEPAGDRLADPINPQ